MLPCPIREIGRRYHFSLGGPLDFGPWGGRATAGRARALRALLPPAYPLSWPALGFRSTAALVLRWPAIGARGWRSPLPLLAARSFAAAGAALPAPRSPCCAPLLVAIADIGACHWALGIVALKYRRSPGLGFLP